MDDILKLLLKSTALTSFLILSGCSTIHPTQIFNSIKQEAAIFNAPANWAGTSGNDQVVRQSWAEIVSDEALLEIVDEALRNNPSQHRAALAIKRSEALVKQARSALLPTLDAQTSPSFSTPLKKASFTDFYGSSLTASWEADIWGRNGSNIASREFDALAAKALYRNARQSLTASVMRSYAIAIEAGRQTVLARETVEDRKATLSVVQKRFEYGTVSKRSLVLAQSDLYLAQDSLQIAQAAEIAAIQGLQVLIGRYPSGKMDVPQNIPQAVTVVSTGQPANILRRRADIVQAEYGVRAAYAIENVTVKGTWPSLSLSSNLSSSVSDILKILDPTDLAFSLGGSLADNLFDGGLSEARIDEATTLRKIALKDYGQSVLNAFADVEGRLNDLNLIDQRYENGVKTVEAAKETLQLAEIQYREGTLDLLDVITFKQRSLQAERTLLTLERQKFESRIALYLALGGSTNVVDCSIDC